MARTALSVERRQIENARVPSVVYRVQTLAGETRTFQLPEVERRHAPTEVELRDDGGDGMQFRGHAAVFGRKSEDLGGFREIIQPGAFKRVLDGNPDVRALFNHNPDLPLARTTNNTLDLREDPRGLHYFGTAADTSYARDLMTLIKRGDVSQSSFAFSMGPESRERWEETEDGSIVRTIIEVDGLFDVSPVTYPAYPQTDVSSHRTLQNIDPAAAEGEPEAETPDVAPVEPAGEGDHRAQQLARLRELQMGAQRRLAIARAK